MCVVVVVIVLVVVVLVVVVLVGRFPGLGLPLLSPSRPEEIASSFLITCPNFFRTGATSANP